MQLPYDMKKPWGGCIDADYLCLKKSQQPFWLFSDYAL